MSRFAGENEQIHDKVRGQARRTGVLLMNLGTPEAPTEQALRRYLAEFLSDPRVVEIPRLLWLAILHGIILRVRPKKSAEAYKTVWTDQGSPLLVISQQQTKALQKQLGEGYVVKLAMRYGEPATDKILQEFRADGIDKIVALPLYPQYAGPTTGSCFDAISAELRQWRWVPELRFINSYFREDSYITALANSLREDIAVNGMPEKLLLSYHGMPKLFLTSGDPYYCQCLKTSRLVYEKLKAQMGAALTLEKDDLISCFQSRFGKAEWLQPYTDKTLEQLPAKGVKNIAIACPAFSADCLETLEEIAEENKQVFLEAGGETYRYIAALNSRDDHIQALAEMVKGE